jgi:hypothetical protein
MKLWAKVLIFAIFIAVIDRLFITAPESSRLETSL